MKTLKLTNKLVTIDTSHPDAEADALEIATTIFEGLWDAHGLLWARKALQDELQEQMDLTWDHAGSLARRVINNLRAFDHLIGPR